MGNVRWFDFKVLNIENQFQIRLGMCVKVRRVAQKRDSKMTAKQGGRRSDLHHTPPPPAYWRRRGYKESPGGERTSWCKRD